MKNAGVTWIAPIAAVAILSAVGVAGYSYLSGSCGGCGPCPIAEMFGGKAKVMPAAAINPAGDSEKACDLCPSACDEVVEAACCEGETACCDDTADCDESACEDADKPDASDEGHSEAQPVESFTLEPC